MSRNRPSPSRVPLSQVLGSRQRPPLGLTSPTESAAPSEFGEFLGGTDPAAARANFKTPSTLKFDSLDHEDILRIVSDELLRLSKVVGSLVTTSRNLAPVVKSASVRNHDMLGNGHEFITLPPSPTFLQEKAKAKLSASIPGLELDLGPAVSVEDSCQAPSPEEANLSVEDSSGGEVQLQLNKTCSSLGLRQVARRSLYSQESWYSLQGPSGSSIFDGDEEPFSLQNSEAAARSSKMDKMESVSREATRQLGSITSAEEFHPCDSMLTDKTMVTEVHACDSMLSAKSMPQIESDRESGNLIPRSKASLKLAPVWQKMLENKKTSRVRSQEGPVVPDESFPANHGYLAGRDFRQKSSSQHEQRVTLTGCLVAHPTARRRLAWDLLGMLLLSYDLLVVPLQAFSPPRHKFTDLMSWTALFFWTLDVPFSFLTGYQAGEFVEMNLKKIAMHYFRSWFFFDICVLFVDWMTSMANEFSAQVGSSSGASLVRLLKGLRFVRVLRLLRLVKAGVLMHELLERTSSDMVLILAHIAKLIVFVLFANHVLACLWYAIGSMDAFNRSWVKENDMEGEGNDIYYRYFTSLHWSMTQFTPASMEVVPANTLERLYTVTVLLFAMITFSSLVSSITNAATQLRNLNKQRLEEYAALRRYLNENKVSAELASTIWGYITAAWDKSQRRFHESDVAILGLLPRSLHSELQHQVYTPTLSVHPFFGQMGIFYPMILQKLYRHALNEVSLAIGQELFSPGERSDTMFFVISGSMLYYHQEDASKVSWRAHASGVAHLTRTLTGASAKDMMAQNPGMLSVGEEDWVSEPAMWIDWHHIGRLAARQQSELLGIKANKFKSFLVQDGNSLPEAPKYAKLWVEYMNNHKFPITDICPDAMAIDNLVSAAFFHPDEEETSTMKSSSTRDKDKDRKRRGRSSRRGSINVGLPRLSRVSTSTFSSRKSMGHSSSNGSEYTTPGRRSIFGPFSKVRLGGFTH